MRKREIDNLLTVEEVLRRLEVSSKDGTIPSTVRWLTMQKSGIDFFDNEQVVLELVRGNGNYFENASQRLREDRGVVLRMVAANGFALGYTTDKLKEDREIVKVAVSNNGYALQFASSGLRDDREIVTAAVSRYGQSLFHASGRMRGVKAVAELAVRQDGKALEHVEKELAEDLEICLWAYESNMEAYSFFPEGVRECLDEIRGGDHDNVVRRLRDLLHLEKANVEKSMLQKVFFGGDKKHESKACKL